MAEDTVGVEAISSAHTMMALSSLSTAKSAD
jgi:hypothetical protein